MNSFGFKEKDEKVLGTSLPAPLENCGFAFQNTSIGRRAMKWQVNNHLFGLEEIASHDVLTTVREIIHWIVDGS
jgi:hypothetical protein